jgi:hypothetical protein
MRLLPVVLIGVLLSSSVAVFAAEAVDASTQPADRDISAQPPARFDSSRHMRVDEVRAGMKGYGLTVLSGTTITKFEVEVISILTDVYGPKQSVVMIRCNDEFMQHVGPIQGCSGSPIYLYDDSGKARLIGAYAYGYDLARDPIIGIQPIEYMLTLEKPERPDAATTNRATTWSLLRSDVFLSLLAPPSKRDLFSSANDTELRDEMMFQPKTVGAAALRRLMTPLAVRGISQSQLDRMSPTLRTRGFEPLLAMGGGKSDASDAKLEPGSVLGALLLSGDMDMAAIGTCTDVIDGRAYGFGHPFMGEGSTSVPMGAGSIDLVMPVLTSSFKLGSVSKVSGAIDMDGTFGVAGEIGTKARTFPIEVAINDRSVGKEQTFRYDCSVHPLMSPMLTGAALQASLTSQKELPRDHTIDYSVQLTFEGGRTVKLDGVASSVNGDNVAQSALWPAMLMANNPFERVNLDGVRVEATIRDQADALELLSAKANASSYKPGEAVTIHLRLRPYRGDVFEKQVRLKLPDDLEDGDYSVSIADATTNLQFETQSKPHEFMVRNIDELFAALEKVAEQSRSDRLFVRLSGTRQHVSIGRTALERLPASKRTLLEAAGRPDTAVAVESSVEVIMMDRAVSGSADLVLHVARKLP